MGLPVQKFGRASRNSAILCVDDVRRATSVVDSGGWDVSGRLHAIQFTRGRVLNGYALAGFRSAESSREPGLTHPVQFRHD